MVVAPGQREKMVYLPAGTWFDLRDHRRVDSTGQWIAAPLGQSGALRLPLYARAGAIIPMASVGPETWNTSGRQQRGAPAPLLRARIYPAERESRFTLFEDDGESVAYQSGEVRETELSQSRRDRETWIEVAAARGSYRGAPSARAVVLEVAGAGRVRDVRADGARLQKRAGLAALEAAGAGWAVDGGLLVVRLAAAPVGRGRRVMIRRD
jgi:alpha-glucosidase